MNVIPSEGGTETIEDMSIGQVFCALAQRSHPL